MQTTGDGWYWRNQVWYDSDIAAGVFTVTWDDVGYFNRKTDKTNAFPYQAENRTLLFDYKLRRREPLPRDSRIFPGMYAPVIVQVDGQRLIRPMRYQCRPAGKPASYDRQYPGTYNARRDNLEGFWRGQFGHTHGLMVASRFYENVEGPEGKNQVLEFVPRDGELMLIACLWSHWSDPKGKEPDLLSFAAITDEPEPEVAAAGHDRTIINIKPEHIDAWLNPDPGNLAALYGIFDDKRHPYYEHRKAA